MPGRDGEKVGVIAGTGLIEAAVDLIDPGGEVVGAGLDGLPVAGFGQQVEQSADGVHQQLFAEHGQYAPFQGIALLIAEIVELLGGDGGTVPAEGTAQ